MTSDRKAFQQTLPKKRMSAGAIFRNEDGDVLLVNPTYKEPWEIPGGIVEANESPKQACIREVKEEIGLTINPARLLIVAYRPEGEMATESLTFQFYGGIIGVEEINKIVLPQDELSEFRFIPPAQIANFLAETVAHRVRIGVDIWDTDQTIYLDEQQSLAQS